MFVITIFFVVFLYTLGQIFIITSILTYVSLENTMVTTPLGVVNGSIMKTVLGKTIYSFRSMRYAQPPVGELRFQPSIPIRKWSGVYDATNDGPACPQPPVAGIPPIAEDCLFINVYTTKLPTSTKTPLRPVIVYLHPSAFYIGTGRSDWAGPRYLLDHDIVLVSFNYRLGSLGFISTGDHWAPGNNGLKDQILALKWTQQNIAAFGGDPKRVTLSSYSAGSMSASTMLLSPMAAGLFHRVILMSGSAYANWPIPKEQIHLAKKQARLVGCPDNTSANIITCLKTKSAKEIGDTMPFFYEYAGQDPTIIWKPVVEPDLGQERFLTENPTKLAHCGHFYKMPVMIGGTKIELGFNAIRVVDNPKLLNEMDKEFDKIAPISFMYERYTERSRNISRYLRKFYLGDGSLTKSSVLGLGELYGDGVTGFGINRAAKLLSAHNKNPVYYYLFTYPGQYSFYYLPDTMKTIGPVHGDDTLYLFDQTAIFPLFNKTSPEFAMVQKLTKLHANFAITGNPTPKSTKKLDNVIWAPFSDLNNKYLDIGDKLAMKKNLYKARYAGWNELFPLPGCA